MRIYVCVIYKKKKKKITKFYQKRSKKPFHACYERDFRRLRRLQFSKNRLDGSGAYARAFYYKQQSNDLHDARERGGRGAGRVPCARARPHPKARVDRRTPARSYKRVFFRSNAFNLLQCVI